MTLILFCLFGSAVFMAGFIYRDAQAAYDGNPQTGTLSGLIKAWRRKAAWRAWLLASVIGSLVLVPAYLFVHLVLEAI